MRRYGESTPVLTVPGRDAGLKLTLQPVTEAPAAIPCQPRPVGLRWFSDLTGGFTEESEAAYLLSEGAAGPVLGVARVLGETCGDVTWRYDWTPASGKNGHPGLIEDGDDLLVYALPASAPGILEVSATCAGRRFGPILFTILRYSCYSYYCAPYIPPANLLGGWLRLADNFRYAEVVGSLNQYGGIDGSVQIGAYQVTNLQFGNLPDARQLFVYANDGGSGYYIVNGDGLQRWPQRGVFAPPWLDAGAPIVEIAGLATLELHSDGYNAPFFLFVR